MYVRAESERVLIPYVQKVKGRWKSHIGFLSSINEILSCACVRIMVVVQLCMTLDIIVF